MRRTLLALLLVTAALAGCLGDPQDLTQAGDDPGGEEPPPDEGNRSRGDDDPADNRSGDRDPGNDTGDAGNETRNRTEDPREEQPPWPDPGEADVRPGVSIAAGTCTANFVFASPDNSTLYVGTAAHCFPDPEPGQRVSIADGAAAGTLAYHSTRTMDRVDESNEAARAFNDFALVAVDDGFRGTVHPAVRSFGGPTGLAPGAEVGDRVLTVGDTNLREGADAADPREGYVTGSSNWHVDVYLSPPSVPGDSGSPVLTADGRALGNLVTIEILPGAGSNDATKIGRAVEYMEAHGGPEVEIVTWDQFSEGRLPG